MVSASIFAAFLYTNIIIIIIIIMASTLFLYPSAQALGLADKSARVTVSLKTNYSTARVRAMAENKVGSPVIEKMGIMIERDPPQSRLSELNVRSWPKWGCPPSKFPWTYTAKETCYLLDGRVKVYPDGYNDFVEIGPKDLVVFPKGMKCTWDVSEAVDKHYTFDD